jgi:L-iditol 2-dehydrogenase
MGIDKDGFFAETVAMHRASLIPVPDGVSDLEAAVIEPIALAVRVFDLLKPAVCDWVTVIGQGPIGLLITQVAKLKGCRVVAADMWSNRLDLARKFGADEIVNVQGEKLDRKVGEITKHGSDIVVEASGSVSAVQQTPRLVRKAGKVALLGEFEGRVDFGRAGDALFFATYLSPIEYPTAVKLVAEKLVDVKSLVTHRFRISDFENALRTASNLNEKPVKVIVTA